jgi:hypothetical protein
MKYHYDLDIEAATEEEADIKMEAITVLLKKLKANELAKLSHVLLHDPVKTLMAKNALKL